MVLLTRLAKQVYRRSSEELLGMHMRLLMALSYVRDHDNTPQQELAEALCMDANNVVLLLNELEDLGYVARRRDPDDRRRHLVELTEEGFRALSERRARAGNDRGRRAAGARPERTRDPVAAADPRAAGRRAGRARSEQRRNRVDLGVGVQVPVTRA